MEAFKERCNVAISQRDRALRTLEHNTLTRLMYVSRNPHRRTPYFTRLEHVRRMLRKIGAHEAWKVLENKKRNNKSNSKNGLRRIDVERLEALVQQVEELVNTVIPATGARWTTELIEREHFVPLATTVVAMLARISALEKPLLKALKSALTEARIIVSVLAVTTPTEKKSSTNTKQSKQKSLPNTNVQQEEEDLGQVITEQEASAKKLTVVSKRKRTRKSGGGRYFQQTEDVATSGVSKGRIEKNNRRDSAPPSQAAGAVGTSVAKPEKRERKSAPSEDLDAIFAELLD